MGPGAFRVYGHSKCSSRAEARLDGKFLLSTSDPDLSAANVALGYKHLLQAERAFRDHKTTMELRPVWHRLERRIRAPVLLCWLALLLVRVAEYQSPDVAADQHRARPAAAGHPVGPTGRVEQTTTLTTPSGTCSP